MHQVQPKEEMPEEAAKPESQPSEDGLARAGSEGDLLPLMSEAGAKPKQRSTRVTNSNAARAALAPKSRPFARRKGFLPILRSYARNAYSTAEERPLVTGLVTASAIILAIAPVIYHFS